LDLSGPPRIRVPGRRCFSVIAQFSTIRPACGATGRAELTRRPIAFDRYSAPHLRRVTGDRACIIVYKNAAEDWNLRTRVEILVFQEKIATGS
jgi:hypothetical protein